MEEKVTVTFRQGEKVAIINVVMNPDENKIEVTCSFEPSIKEEDESLYVQLALDYLRLITKKQ
jgi:hypothetical protein